MGKPIAKLVGEDGNIFNLMNIAQSALRKNGQAQTAKEMVERINQEAMSYTEALAILQEYVEVV